MDYVARIDYLGSNGKVGESVYYTDAERFQKAVLNELWCGVPLEVVLFRQKDGSVIPHDFLFTVDTLPKALQIVEQPSGEEIA